MAAGVGAWVRYLATVSACRWRLPVVTECLPREAASQLACPPVGGRLPLRGEWLPAP